MWTFMDTIGASSIGAAVILMVIAINMQMNSFSSGVIENNLLQRNFTASVEVLDYDLHKMGYRVSGEKILLADSTRIRYLVDLENNGSIDTVYYSIVSIGADSLGNTKLIKRNVNNTQEITTGMVSDFRMSYLDSLGNKLSYVLLADSLNRLRIRSIELKVDVATRNKEGTGYDDVDWYVSVRPKNLGIGD